MRHPVLTVWATCRTLALHLQCYRSLQLTWLDWSAAPCADVGPLAEGDVHQADCVLEGSDSIDGVLEKANA